MSLERTVSSRTSRASTPSARPRSARSGKNEKLSNYTRPMLASIHGEPFSDPDWIFEVKWDGYRAIAEHHDEEVKLYSRNGLSFLRLYPTIASELRKFRYDVVLDGEIVVLNEKGKSDFQKLQQYDNNPSLQLVYYVFDCLSYRGKSLMSLPLTERKKIAKQLLPKSKVIKYSDHVQEKGVLFFSKIVEMDVEGMIAKRASSLYHPGRRSRDWLKIKNHNTQEAVIAGYTAPRGSREHFGALILGIYENRKLKYIGHTGTGFTSAVLKDLYAKLKPLQRKSSPFDKKVVVNSPVTWVEPVLVCAIKFTEMTEEGILRHPVFLGLRVDKSAGEANSIDVAVASATRAPQKGKTKSTPSASRKKEDVQSKTKTAKKNGS